MAQTQRSPAADRASAEIGSGRTSAAENSTRLAKVQILDADGHRLPDRRGLLIPDAPRRAVPGWYALARDRWVRGVIMTDALADLFRGEDDRVTLRSILDKACLDTGSTLADLTALSPQNDPYRLDTPTFHTEGAWLAEQMVNLRLAHRRIHLRGLHYALVSTSGLVKPNGDLYRNTEKDWLWLQSSAAKAARWLRYVRFDPITDERNSPPVIKVKATEPVETFVYIGDGIEITVPDLEDMRPTVGISNFGARQPYHLVVYGEKTSLADVLMPLCERYDADLYLPSGEISDTLLYQMAKVGAEDGRPMVLLVLATSIRPATRWPCRSGASCRRFEICTSRTSSSICTRSRSPKGMCASSTCRRLRSRRPSAEPMAGAPPTAASSRPRSMRSRPSSRMS